MISARAVLCLSLLASGVGVAQTPKEAPPASSQPSLPPPPLLPAPEQPEPPAPPGESIPYQYRPEMEEESSTAKRIALELLAGAGTGAVSGIMGLFAGGLLINFDCTGVDCVIVLLGSMTLGVVLGTPLGVYGVGRVMDGRGAYWASLAGTALGSAVGIVLAAAAGSARLDVLAFVSLIAGPLVGAVLGYEISHSYAQPGPPAPTSASSASASFQWVPVVAVTPTGGLLGGLAGRF